MRDDNLKEQMVRPDETFDEFIARWRRTNRIAPTIRVEFPSQYLSEEGIKQLATDFSLKLSMAIQYGEKILANDAGAARLTEMFEECYARLIGRPTITVTFEEPK